jgi:hypothetical protein
VQAARGWELREIVSGAPLPDIPNAWAARPDVQDQDNFIQSVKDYLALFTRIAAAVKNKEFRGSLRVHEKLTCLAEKNEYN